jgi:Family of unknown function (DUF695)/Regulator of ribonuclease activity B
MKHNHLLYRMKHILLILLSLYQIPANAQNEHWDTYMAKFGNKPASVLVDMGQVTVAPDQKYQNLVITGPRVQNCNKQGLPDKEEINTLEDILDGTGNFLTGVTPKVLVGTVTYNCERLNYYYVKDTVGIRNAIARMYGKSYPNYTYTIRIKHDPEWVSYRTFLYPDEPTLNWMENDKIITKMIQQGDTAHTLRDINFDLFFKTDTDRSAFVVFAKTKGYKVAAMPAPKNANAPFEVVVATLNYIKMDIINPMTEELKAAAKKHHGFFSGWEVKK